MGRRAPRGAELQAGGGRRALDKVALGEIALGEIAPRNGGSG